VLAAMSALGIATALVLSAFSDNLVFFYSPTEITTKHVPPDRRFRVGGLVEEKSVTRGADGVTVSFRVTDKNQSVPVTYRGVLPDLFREGQGVVAEGKLDNGGTFQASEVLAKHDERYMPPEVVEALKKSGRWQEDAAASAPATPALEAQK
jgi:cytochrome c-type biogenesis protein CcmE